MPSEKILLSHGSGGMAMHRLIRESLLKKLHNPVLKELGDSAFLDYREKCAFTTDSFVVSPLFFPGGDIGKLAICGTVNDLVMLGSKPEYLSLGLIIEEGLERSLLEKIIDSLARQAKKSRALIATGDLKVVEKGACDKIFINTSGIGRIIIKRKLTLKNISPGDRIILTGNIAQHGLAVLSQRKGLNPGFNISSDCAALDGLILPVVKKIEGIKFMRDPTRGGVATTLNEIAQGAKLCLVIDDKNIPIAKKTQAACELLGIDPLYVANEGVALLICEKDQADKTVRLLRKHPLGRNSAIIGIVERAPQNKVILNTALGTQRIIDMLSGETLPRVC